MTSQLEACIVINFISGSSYRRIAFWIINYYKEIACVMLSKSIRQLKFFA